MIIHDSSFDWFDTNRTRLKIFTNVLQIFIFKTKLQYYPIPFPVAKFNNKLRKISSLFDSINRTLRKFLLLLLSFFSCTAFTINFHFIPYPQNSSKFYHRLMVKEMKGSSGQARSRRGRGSWHLCNF